MRPCLRKSCPGPLAGDNARKRAGAAIRGVGGGALRMLAAFLRDTSGAVAIMVLLLLPVLIGFMGISVDVGLWYTARRGMQNIADAAAMSGAGEIANGSADSIVRAAAQSAADSNGFDATDGSVITINVPPTEGPSIGDDGSIEVIINRPMVLLFTRVFSTLRGETFAATATVRAVANTNFVSEFCILGLDPTASKAVEVSGTGQLTLDCGIAVNSDADNALSVSGNAVATITSVSTVGEVSIIGGGILDSGSPPRRGNVVDDPYDDLKIPNFTGCDEDGSASDGGGGQGGGGGGGASGTVQVNGNKTFDASTGTTPGIFVFCGGLKINAGANVTFAPGVYIIDGGDFDIGGQSTITGDGVTFILTSSPPEGPSDIGSVKIVGGSTLELTAPDTDPLNADGYSGVLFYQDRDVPGQNKNNFIAGGAELDFEGALYFPSEDLDFAGGSKLADGCVQLIGATVKITGDTGIQGNCGNTGTRSVGRLRASLGE